MNIKLSIVIINFNTPNITCDCLASVSRYLSGANLSWEILLVDNAPKACYQKEFEECTDKLKYIKVDSNIGFGKANNLAMDAASGKYLLLLNSDTLLIDDSLCKCIDLLDDDNEERIGMLGCKLLNEDHSYQHSYYPFVQNSLLNYFKVNNPLLRKIFRTDLLYQESFETKKVGDISGAFMLLRKTVFEKVKGFDPDFFLYCEETEWCRNRIAPVYDIVYFPHAKIVHLGGQSAPKSPMKTQSLISEFLFWYKCGLVKYLLFLLFGIFNTCFYLLQYIFTSQTNRRDIKDFIKRYLIALRYGIMDIPRYRNTYSARKKPLIYHRARNVFFGDTPQPV